MCLNVYSWPWTWRKLVCNACSESPLTKTEGLVAFHQPPWLWVNCGVDSRLMTKYHIELEESERWCGWFIHFHHKNKLPVTGRYAHQRNCFRGMIIRIIYHIPDYSATYIKCSIHNTYMYFYVYVCVCVLLNMQMLSYNVTSIYMISRLSACFELSIIYFWRTVFLQRLLTYLFAS